MSRSETTWVDPRVRVVSRPKISYSQFLLRETSLKSSFNMVSVKVSDYKTQLDYFGHEARCASDMQPNLVFQVLLPRSVKYKRLFPPCVLTLYSQMDGFAFTILQVFMNT